MDRVLLFSAVREAVVVFAECSDVSEVNKRSLVNCIRLLSSFSFAGCHCCGRIAAHSDEIGSEAHQ